MATFIIYNLDIAPEIHDMAKASNAESPSSCPKLSDEQKAPLRLEEAALRCRVIAELAQRCLGQEPSCLFMDNLLNDILHILVLQGYSPSVTPAALVDRIKEYSQYKKWTRKKEKARLALCYGKQANIF